MIEKTKKDKKTQKIINLFFNLFVGSAVIVILLLGFGFINYPLEFYLLFGLLVGGMVFLILLAKDSGIENYYDSLEKNKNQEEKFREIIKEELKIQKNG